MKELIEKTGLTLKEFSELYEIPYNTVRQWYNEERQAPNYIKKLIEENRKLKTKGEQLSLEEIEKKAIVPSLEEENIIFLLEIKNLRTEKNWKVVCKNKQDRKNLIDYYIREMTYEKYDFREINAKEV